VGEKIDVRFSLTAAAMDKKISPRMPLFY
jgi:hypothetical protein